MLCNAVIWHYDCKQVRLPILNRGIQTLQYRDKNIPSWDISASDVIMDKLHEDKLTSPPVIEILVVHAKKFSG